MKARSSYISILNYQLGSGEQKMIIYYNDKKQPKHVFDAMEKIENNVLFLSNGGQINVDNIISVDGEISTNYISDFDGCSCM